MIETYYHRGYGYVPFLIRENWQVAQLNYQPKNGLDDIDKIEVHRQTDEVFVLVKGEAVLVTVEFEPMTFECQRMEVGVTYNIPAGTWHNIAMERDAEIIIVENANTHKKDCSYMDLNLKQRQDLYKKIMDQLEYATETIILRSPLDCFFFEADFIKLNELWGNQIFQAKGLVKVSGEGWQQFDMLGNTSQVTSESEVMCRENGFLSIGWPKSDPVSPVEWLSTFLNAEEVVCPVQNLKVEETELFHYMGYKDTEPEACILDLVRRLKAEALSICCPRVGFRFLTGMKKDDSHLLVGGNVFETGLKITNALQHADFYVEMVSTIGKELDVWVTEKRNGDDVMVAYVADIVGSVIAESVVSFGQEVLEQRMKRWNLKVSNAYSPGYCDWDVAQQQLFFSMLPSDFCGIRLTESSMMLPIKSVSSLLAVGKKVEKKPYGCSICRNKKCFKRKNFC